MRIRRAIRAASLVAAPLLAACGAVLASGPARAQDNPEWTQPHDPFAILGPIHYVGTRGIAVYLIETSDGLILIDSGPEAAAPIVERNIAALGFSPRDVKIILTTHAHVDHVAGIAALKQATGARLLVSAGDRGAMETGVPPSDTDYGVWKFTPAKVDGIVEDGVPVRLGDTALVPVLTPGHTPGCTSWSMQVDGKAAGLTGPLRVFFPCSLTVAGNKLAGNRGYPGIVGDFRKSLDRLRAMEADVVLPAHPEFGKVIERAQRRDAGDKTAFVAPQLLPELVASSQAAFDKALATAERAR